MFRKLNDKAQLNIKFFALFLIILCSFFVYAYIENDVEESWLAIPDTNFTLNYTSGITNFEVKAYNQTWLDMNKTSDNITLPEDFLEDRQAERSIVVWSIRKDEDSVGGLLGDWYITDEKNHTQFYLGTNNKTAIKVSNNTDAIISTRSNGLPADNKWHQVVASISQTSPTNTRLRLYTDTGSQVSGNDRIFWYNETHPNIFTPRIGRYYYVAGGTSFINGSIDEVSVYNRELTGNDVTELYNQSVHGTNLGKAVIIFSYHGINDTEAAGGSSNSYVSAFTEQMAYLNSSGVETITYQQLDDWKNGIGVIPERSIIINFDDAYLSVYNQAKPIMDLYGFIGTFSLNTEDIGSLELNSYGSYSINWTQVSEMYDDGWEFISHGTWHNDSTSLTYEERQAWFNDSKYEIYNQLGYFPITFVYPWAIANDTIHIECLNYYTYCVNLTAGFGVSNQYNHLNNIEGKEIHRMTSIGNTTTIASFKPVMGIYADKVLELDLNENSGTTAHDTSGNSNDGTISGATWTTDGILNTLTAITDYTLSTTTGLFTLVNTAYEWAMLYFTYSVDDCTCPGENNNWTIYMSDSCNINSTCNLGTGKLSFTGTGTTQINSTINTTNLGDPGANGILEILSNCRINIFN